MRIFAFEFLFFIVSVFSILVCISATALFAITYRFERKIRSIWRALGFMLLGISFFFLILERKYVDIELISVFAILLMSVGVFSIYRGIRAEPILSQLANVKTSGVKKLKEFNLVKEFTEPRNRNLLMIVISIVLILGVVSVILTILNLGDYVIAVLLIVAAIFATLTLVIQIKRYLAQKDIKETRLQNLFPLLGYVFFVISLIGSIFHRLPESNVLFFRQISLDYSWLWHAITYTFLATFVLIGIWAWNFIKIRRLLKIFVVFLSAIILVAATGSLIFNIFLFNIVEKNNLDLMERGAETQELIMTDRSNVSMLIAGLMAKDEGIRSLVDSDDYDSILNNTTDYLDKTNVDRIRVYNKYGEIIVSPTEERDRGRVLSEDILLSYAIIEKSPVKSFELGKGVLADVMLVRSFYPIIEGNEVRGAVEVGYEFDNAFTDYSKSQTGLDATIYSGSKRSATTILTLDNVSRWIGSEEIDARVLEKVLVNGQDVRVDTDRLGITYYSAYKPIRNINGEVIGMVSVGIPTNILFEDARQQLLSVFLIISIIALLSAVFGAYVLYVKQNR